MPPNDAIHCRLPQLCLFVAGALALCSSSASADEDAPSLEVNLTEIVEVVLVNVEVWVTDRKGDPIHGLGKSDFEVFENGRPREITHLTEIRGRMAATATQPPGSMATENAPAPPQVVDPAAHLVLYFDQMHLSATSVRQIAKDLKRFLASERVPASQVAILTQGYDLDLQAGFGSTTDQLTSALEQIASAGTAVGGSFDARLAMGRMQQNWETSKNVPSPCRLMANLAQAEIATRVAELRHHFGITLDNLHATTRFLAGLPGPKMLVLVSDSFELDPGRDLLRFAKNVCPNERDLDELSLLGDAADLRQALVEFALSANANRVTFYPMQASGLITSSLFGAENRSLDTVASRGVDSMMRQVQQDGLFSLARETGGVATVNRNNFKKPLESVARDMQNYYSLAYAPTESGTGENRTIEVRVKAPQAKVRHRPGYRDKTANEILGERLEGAIAFGVMDNPLALRLAVGTLVQQPDGTQKIPLHLLVPAENLVFLPGKQPQARVEVVVRASTAGTGEVIDVTEVLTAHPPAQGADLCDLVLDISLPSGVYVLGVAARDLSTNVTSVVSTTIGIGERESRQSGP